MVRNGMTRAELLNLVDEDKATSIMNVAEAVRGYLDFREMTDLGLTVPYNRLTFEQITLYSWIKRELKD